jgi:hypothetical protein
MMTMRLTPACIGDRPLTIVLDSFPWVLPKDAVIWIAAYDYETETQEVLHLWELLQPGQDNSLVPQPRLQHLAPRRLPNQQHSHQKVQASQHIRSDYAMHYRQEEKVEVEEG